jgi:uncharacterized protein
MELKNTVGILTGASRGIGIYLAEALAKEGVDLALAARSAEDLEITAKKLNGYGTRIITVPTDVNKQTDLGNLVERTTDELGPIDLLVNNAGVEGMIPFEEMDFSLIEKILTTNLVSLELLTRLVVPGMIERKHGHVVNIASMAGKTSVPFNTVYSSSKHGVIGFSWSLRAELRAHNIGVSAVAPGFVSGAGMFMDWSDGKPPGMSPSVTPEAVAKGTIRAIEKNKAEVSVVPGAGMLIDLINAISPDLGSFMQRRVGLYGYLEKGARAGKARR